MAPNRGGKRASDFDDLIDAAPQDLDPEADDIPEDDSDDADDLDSEQDPEAARDHYLPVGKSNLRKPKEVPLGPQYRGSRVSRNAVTDDENEDDPFERGWDDADSDEESAEQVEDSEDDEDDETPDTDVDEDMARPRLQQMAQVEKKMALPSLMAEQKVVAEHISRGMQADVEKGRAVKRQRTTFDSLLGTRMKLQKALIGVNTVVGLSNEERTTQKADATAVIESAEMAAFNLYSSLTSFREDLLAAKTGQKRKRSPSSSGTSTAELWSQYQSQEEDSLAHRNSALQFWSAKTQPTTSAPQRNRVTGESTQTTVLDVIREHLSDPSRLLQRAQTPRSCAPLQLSRRNTFDPAIYDDADFYGLMLKELLEAKSADSVAASTIDVSFQMRREAKTKKNVDTKASKGRKLRYTVHEKLQNFMAPEDRGGWGDRQRDELFGSLFGQRLGLGEERMQDEDVLGSEGDQEEAGLMLFRS